MRLQVGVSRDVVPSPSNSASGTTEEDLDPLAKSLNSTIRDIRRDLDAASGSVFIGQFQGS